MTAASTYNNIYAPNVQAASAITLYSPAAANGNMASVTNAVAAFLALFIPLPTAIF